MQMDVKIVATLCHGKCAKEAVVIKIIFSRVTYSTAPKSYQYSAISCDILSQLAASESPYNNFDLP